MPKKMPVMRRIRRTTGKNFNSDIALVGHWVDWFQSTIGKLDLKGVLEIVSVCVPTLCK